MNLNTHKLKIILVEPLGEINIGSVARLCANFDVNELRLVSPLCDPMSTDSIKMAVHGKRFLENVSIYSNLIDAINDCGRVVATCGRIDHGNIPLHSSENALKWLLEKNTQKPIAIIFGREDRGLKNSELQMAQKVLTLRTSHQYPSLNLSHAVGIVLHELSSYSQKDFSHKLSSKAEPASAKELNDFLEDTKSLLLEVGFLLQHTSQARISKIKGLLQRAEARSEDIALIRGMIRQIRWFSQNKNQDL
ncbi:MULTISPECIES: RNA methyltransferase [unclassified Prochlorococcus]|uniref:RNA methyltransferase n=1 Tax=unclassified Prochlorococcus TaxID=2627481 RepID=UPI0005339D53|nr:MULTISPECIES: RNA methyltransferase [unclassified Prochlorococcus]KGG15471.1 tRNA:Cm32/Um32 methyltransferase [Prochlorococcus sp. MIT 0602]KGG17751.1 tRNA:Cm32/Um32 methyltransferase [Prochlorococcus sp. MIT 0603]